MSKKSKSSLIGLIIVILIVVLLVGGLGYFSQGFKDWTVKDWFKFDKTDEDTSIDSDLQLMSSTLNLLTVLNVTN